MQKGKVKYGSPAWLASLFLKGRLRAEALLDLEAGIALSLEVTSM